MDIEFGPKSNTVRVTPTGESAVFLLTPRFHPLEQTLVDCVDIDVNDAEHLAYLTNPSSHTATKRMVLGRYLAAGAQEASFTAQDGVHASAKCDRAPDGSYRAAFALIPGEVTIQELIPSQSGVIL